MKRTNAVLVTAALIVSSCANEANESDAGSSPAPVESVVAASSTTSTLPSTTVPETTRPATTLPSAELHTCHPEDMRDDEVTTVTLWSTLNVDAELLLNELIVRFNTLHSDVQVNLQYTEDPLSLLRRLRAGERPDLLIMGIEGLVNLDDSGILTAAEECLANDPTAAPEDLLPIAAATYQLGGRQIAMPLSVSTPVLYFDRAKVRQAGLDPDRPPADLTQLAEQISTMQAAGVATDGLTYADATWFVTQLAAQHGITLATDGNGHDRPATSVRATLTDTGLADVLTPIGEMAAAGLITAPVRNESGFDDLLRLIDRERPAAMALHTSGAASRVYDLIGNDPSSSVEVGIAPMPGPVGGSLVGGSALWITSPEPARAWAAWTLTRFLTDSEQQARFGQLGYAPARLSATGSPTLLAAWASRPGLRVAFDVLVGVAATAATWSVAVGTQPEFVWRLNWAAEDVISGRDPRDALADAERDINRLLETYDGFR